MAVSKVKKRTTKQTPTSKSGSVTIDTTELSNEPGKSNVVELVIKENSPHYHNKKYAQENVGEGNMVTFLSTKKQMMLFVDDSNTIGFKNYVFKTNNQESIDYLREQPMYGIEIFEGDYPAEVKKAIAEKRKYFTKDKSEHGGN